MFEFSLSSSSSPVKSWKRKGLCGIVVGISCSWFFGLKFIFLWFFANYSTQHNRTTSIPAVILSIPSSLSHPLLFFFDLDERMLRWFLDCCWQSISCIFTCRKQGELTPGREGVDPPPNLGGQSLKFGVWPTCSRGCSFIVAWLHISPVFSLQSTFFSFRICFQLHWGGNRGGCLFPEYFIPCSIHIGDRLQSKIAKLVPVCWQGYYLQKDVEQWAILRNREWVGSIQDQNHVDASKGLAKRSLLGRALLNFACS